MYSRKLWLRLDTQIFRKHHSSSLTETRRYLVVYVCCYETELNERSTSILVLSNRVSDCFAWLLYSTGGETESCQDLPDGEYQDSLFCNRFYTCMDGKATVKLCSRGLLFDPATRQCLDKVPCPRKLKTSFPNHALKKNCWLLLIKHSLFYLRGGRYIGFISRLLGAFDSSSRIVKNTKRTSAHTNLWAVPKLGRLWLSARSIDPIL